MIADIDDLPAQQHLEAEIAVVGSGPAGIVLALELAAAGRQVLLLESGRQQFSPAAQRLSESKEYDPDFHADLTMASRRQVGGTSVIWGGRCVPYDSVDFDRRPYIANSEWPISYEEQLPYYTRACDWLVCGRPVFDSSRAPSLARSIVPGLPDGSVRGTSLERWSLPTNFGRIYGKRLRESPNIRLITGLTCTEIVTDPDGGVDHLACRSLAGRCVEVRGKQYVLAAGGLETTRLLLASRGREGNSVGNHSDNLGRWYMGHLEGVVAHARFSTPPRETVFGYERDVDGVFVRKRLSLEPALQHQRELPNVVSWIANHNLADSSHHSGVLSFVYLMLASPFGRYFAPDAQRLSLIGKKVPGSPYPEVENPGTVWQHLANLANDPVETAKFMASFGSGRFLTRGRKTPGFFAYRSDNTYPLQYHGEHRPWADSRVLLSHRRDALGMPQLHIDIKFHREDIAGIAEVHSVWDEYLRDTGVGRLEYLSSDVQSLIRSRAGGGFHQVGTTRMSADPAGGVVDANLAVHGYDNLFVASSSTFASSGQANSTFLIVVMALRLADHLRHLEDATKSD